MKSDVEKTVEGFREKFKHVPLGRWTSSIEYGPWPVDVWEFFDDGTGRVNEYSAGGNNIVRFEWRTVRERVIEIHVIEAGESIWYLPDDPDDTDAWWTIEYDFKIIEYYVPHVVMFSLPESAKGHFFMTEGYLHYQG